MTLKIDFFLDSLAVLSLQLLLVAAKRTISPSYVWPLRYIYNKTVPVVPPLLVHGDVFKEDTALYFDGKTAWLDAGELSGSCIAHPQSCINGLTVAIRIKLNSSENAASPKFLFDSGGFSGDGVSIYLKNDQLVAEVANSQRVWRTSSALSSNNWHFVLLTWSINDGLMLFIDGPMKSQNSQPTALQFQPVAKSNHVVVGKCNSGMPDTFASFSSDLIALFDSVTPDGKIYLSYSFSAPSTRGNIRYVNAKFINSADFDLTIFPDRGEHQTIGYQLESRSSTLLEYVLREGPLPIGMNFALKNKKNGEVLNFNGKDNLHVVSSDDKQVINEYMIKPDSSMKLLTSTSGVSIDYQVRAAQASIQEHFPTGLPTKPVTSVPKPTKAEELSTDNPEVPVDDDNQTSSLSSNETTFAPTTVNPNELPRKESGATSMPIPLTTAVIPTIPPPPTSPATQLNETNGQINTTATESNVTESISNITESGPISNVSNTGSSMNVSEHGFNDTGPGMNNSESSLNETGSTLHVNGSDLNISESYIEPNKSGSNVTNFGQGSANPNASSPSQGSNGIQSPEMPEEDEQLNGDGLSNNVTGNLTDWEDLNVPNGNESVSETTKMTDGNITADYNVSEAQSTNLTSSENGTSSNSNETEAGQNVANINTKETKEQGAAIPMINSPNPWLRVAQYIKEQQTKALPWDNGKGVYNALHGVPNDLPKGKPGGLATVNYNVDKNKKLTKLPVWQYVKGNPITGEWLGESQRLKEEQTLGSTPFKFANARTQELTKSYYTDNKINDVPKVQNQYQLTDDSSWYVKSDIERNKKD